MCPKVDGKQSNISALPTAAVAGKKKRNAKGLYLNPGMDPSIVSLATVIERLGPRPPAWLNVSTSKGNRHRTSDEDRRANSTRGGIRKKDEG